MFTPLTFKKYFLLFIMAFAMWTGQSLSAQQSTSPLLVSADIVSFEGEAMGQANRLMWTAFQAGVIYYSVERSTGVADTWEELAAIPAKLTDEAISEYGFMDIAPLPTGVYRVRAVRSAGESEISSQVEIFRGYSTHL
ncbi:hypothetical protein [Lewinella sp. IMCC34191]|uniref:hypothetical protein n=1 Tax=Lewinella sp. IMCC34191 TaxID=2259172 RepID=UPI000E223449|nr:hypothetical protein [Lewinella sp. IMCC34191]